jgi:RNase P subunit RPR2
MYMCQSCKGKFSNIGSNGLCIECCRKNRAVNIENEKMKQLIITNDFDYEIISSVTGKSIAEIEEFVKENEIKISKSLKLYRCSQCNRPTIHMYSKQGVTGLCRACAKEINQKLNFESGKIFARRKTFHLI